MNITRILAEELKVKETQVDATIKLIDEVLFYSGFSDITRIKELIYGGSTVLMVSHGMGTILENCSKVAWIEKGVLQMVGEAKTVCAEYQKMGGV